jgi:transposase
VGESALAGGKKNARRRKAWILFEDESGISQQPAIRRTWAPRGETPVLIHNFNWKKMSVAAALAYRWDGKRCGLLFQLRAGSYDTESLIGFLRQLKRHVRGKKVILIWDQLPGHKSRPMQEYLRSQRSWLRVEYLPGYAPDLNPVEPLWGNLKGQELANRCAENLGETVSALENGMARVGRSSQLCFAFLDHAGLSF